MADLSNVINVSLLKSGTSLPTDNMNIVAIITSETGVLSTSERYKTYLNASSVENDFGTASDVSQFANVFFSQSPNPAQAGGYLVVGFWRAVDETVSAKAGKLTGGQLQEKTVITQLQSISDGSFDITVGVTTENITALDFRTVTTLSDVIDLLNGGLTDATATLSNDKIIITNNSTGASASITHLSSASTGTFIGNILQLSSSSTATVEAGADATTISAETKLTALSELKSQVNFKGACFIDNILDSEVPDIASWVQSNDVLMYDVFGQESYLDISTTNPVWNVKLSNQNHYRSLYHTSNDRKMACAYMSRMHTVNFNAVNSCITMHLKELVGITADTVISENQTNITKARNVGLDIYPTFKNVGKVLTSGANDFTDNPYNLIAFIDAVKTETFNALGTTATKIPQNAIGINQLTDVVEKVCQRFVDAGFIGAGTWNSTDSFGDIDVFKRAISEKGFYVLFNDITKQSQADRENRASPVCQVAIKSTGAVHSVDIIVNFEE